VPDPAVVLSLVDVREDPARGWSVPQRDSFRLRGPATVCSLRPPPRPLLLEYQVLVAAHDRAQALQLGGSLLGCLHSGMPLRVNGLDVPVQALPAPVRTDRERTVLTPFVLQLATRQESGDRQEVPWIRTGRVDSGPLDNPADQEGIVLRL
jgi:hypothetical protein